MSGTLTSGRGWARRGVSAAIAVGLLAGTGTAARAAAGVHPAVAGVISTVAGGVGGPVLGTKVGLLPCGVAFGSGFLYTGAGGAGGNAVRKVNPATDWLTTPAGSGSIAPLGNGGPAAKAGINGVCGVAVDHSGNLLITGNDLVRVVAAASGVFYGRPMTAGHIYTVAGNGGGGYTGDGGPATSAQIGAAEGVAVDGAGNLVIADTYNNRIRVVATTSSTFYGQPMTAGDIYTVAGTSTRGFSGDGGPAASAELHSPRAVAIDGAGNLVIADTYNYRVRVVAAAAGTFFGQPMSAGDIYTVAGNGARGFSGDGGPATSAKLYRPNGVAIDGAGNLVIADTDNHRVRVVAAAAGPFYRQPMTAGHIYTVAGNGSIGYSGDGGLATRAEFDNPYGVAADGAGNVIIGDVGNNRVRVAAASTGMFYGRPMTAGHIYTVAGNGHLGFSGDGGPATSAKLSDPAAEAIDGAGNLVVDDIGNQRIRVVAATTGSFYGQPMTAGDIYTVAGDGAFGFAGDGGPATSAEFDDPAGVAVDSAGNLLIADTGNDRIRVVATSTGMFYGQPMTAGDVYTVAGDGRIGFAGDGGPATSAALCDPAGVVADGAGNLVIADGCNYRIRVVAASTGMFYGQPMTAGDIYTVAGSGSTAGFSGDGGPATHARMGHPAGVAVDGAGNLLIADPDNQRIREVATTTGMFYGQPMTAGDIYTVAGNGHLGFSGDGGPAPHAELWTPAAVAVDGAGLLIADTDNQRIREVSG